MPNSHSLPLAFAVLLPLALATPSQGSGPSDRDAGTCTPSATVLCLQGARFSVEVAWEDPDVNTGTGQVLPIAVGDAGFFYFTDPELPEVGVRVLDGTSLNGFWWVYFGALTDWEYTLTVTDTVTFQQQSYFNSLGTFASVQDISALPDTVRLPVPAGKRQAMAAPPQPLERAALRGVATACSPGVDVLCLDSRRFQVEVDWRDFSDSAGAAQTAPLTDLAGYFTFFQVDNLDLTVKIVDGGSGSFWFFYGSLTNVEFTITVTDVCNGAVKTYVNPLGILTSAGDFNAFAVTPTCTAAIFTDGFESGNTMAW